MPLLLSTPPLVLFLLRNGKVLGCSPFRTLLPVAGSKKMFGLLAESWACTRPFSSELFGAFWQKTELRRIGGFVVKSWNKQTRVSVLHNTGSGQTGGVFFSTWRYSWAIAIILACVAVSNWWLASVPQSMRYLSKPKQSAFTNYRVCHILLTALGLCHEQRSDRLACQIAANLSRTSISQLLQDNRFFLAETSGVQVDRPVISLEPPFTPECLLRR